MNKKNLIIMAAALAITGTASVTIVKRWPAHKPARPKVAAPAPAARKVLYWYDPMNPAKHYDKPGKEPSMGMDLLPKYDVATAPASVPARRILYWTDPMQAGSRFDKPGKSPLMDMDLVPVYASSPSSALPGEVSIAPAMLQHSALRYATAQPGRLSAALTVVGTVRIDEHRITTVISKMGGWISAMPVRALSDRVAAGALIARIHSPDARQMADEASLARGDAALLQAAHQRMRTWGVASDGSVNVMAPQGGVVTEILVRPGARVEPGQTLMTLANLDRVWVMGELPENALARVKQGQTVAITLSALPGLVLHGKVDSLLPQLNPESRTLPVRVSLANPGGRLKPGMLASLSFDGGNDQTLLIPSEAIIRTGRRTLVMIVRDNGHFAPVSVLAGREADGRTEILAGLAPGQRIVASGQFLLDSESNLQHGLDTMDRPDEKGLKP